MLNKICQFLNRSKNNINDNINDFRKTKWLSEFLKIAITSILTIVFLYFIRLFSSGNFEGVKLQNYLDENIMKYVDTANIESQILYNGTYDLLSDDKVIFVYSKYTRPESDNLGNEYYEEDGEYYDGVCLSIFERKERSVINDILGTEPAYQLSFCSNIEGYSMLFKFKDFSYTDLDNDGVTEFCLYTNSYFATTSSHEFTVFSKDNGKWSVVEPNIEKIRKSIGVASDNNCIIDRGLECDVENDIGKRTLYLNAAVLKLNDLLHSGQCYNILAPTDYGGLFYTENPFNSSFEICYIFSCNYDDSQKCDKDYIYIMQQFNNKELFTDPNWNMGEPLISDELINMKENSDTYWGKQNGKNIYFAIPDVEADN